MIGRKAWPFSDTPKGAIAGVQVETAKVNSREPSTLRCHVLERLPPQYMTEYEPLFP